MSYFIFAVAEIVGIILLAAFAKGLIGILPAGLVVIVMLSLSFHVLARRDKPDGTSIRMASFAAALWYATILGGKLVFENRGGMTTVVAVLFTLFTLVLAAFATWSVHERPLDYDVEEAE
jgi:hypothetical protein